jgi:RAB protein geranylgeranyltransferase component A
MKFELKHRDELGIEDYENHSAWAQYYSADEIVKIAREGYKKEEIERRLAEVDWSDDYWFKTNHSKNTTPYIFTRFLADFELPNKLIVKGFIEYTAYSGVQNYCLHVDGEFIVLNIQHPEITDEEELELKTKLNLERLYPMKIKSSDRQLNIEEYRPKKQ